ncbi:hypothetical protein NCS52_00933500 [Fusarium sp. LHS14.1]|nr:hypothetical protein NCS52_00933500 [Fusarium sp. LHS14.1]
MTTKNAGVSKGVVTQVTQLDSVAARYNIEFVHQSQTKLFCHNVSAGADNSSPVHSNFSQWCNRRDTLGFLERLSKSPRDMKEGTCMTHPCPSFTLIGGYGNGTLHPLSLDRDLFDDIMKAFKFPDRVKEVICSVHGVFSRFVEYDRGAPRSLLFLFSTPKSPVREIVCAMRIDSELASVTCLLLDARLDDLRHTVGVINSSTAGLAWRDPVGFLAILLKESGSSSEMQRKCLDNDILNAEIRTKSTQWRHNANKSPNDFYEATSKLNLCHNNLVFVGRAADSDIDNWRFLRRMADDENLRPWLRGFTDEGEWVGVLDSIDFETEHAVSRRAQIGCLKERIEVQISLISNLIAHQETSQTNLIAILALIFAPASLIAGIFSAGIFTTNDRSWIVYVASTVPITVLTVVAGVGFLKQKELTRQWWELVVSRRDSPREVVPEAPASWSQA